MVCERPIRGLFQRCPRMICCAAHFTALPSWGKHAHDLWQKFPDALYRNASAWWGRTFWGSFGVGGA